MMCGLAVLAKGLRRAGAAGDRVRRLPGVHLELEAAAAGADPARRCCWPRWRCWWWRCPGTTPCTSATTAPGGTSCSATTTGAGWCWAATATGAPSSTSSASWAIRTLPWLAIAPAALAAIAMKRVGDVRRQAIYWLGAIWFVSAYAVVSNSMTKFHHYILPAIPGLAIVIGCFLDELWEKRGQPARAAGGADRAAAAAAGGAGPGQRQERLADLPVAVLVRLHPQPARPALARPAGLQHAADRVRGAVRAC